MKTTWFAFAVGALELAAATECAWKGNYRMAAVWLCYAISNIMLAFVK